jgi:hypothetical protein
MGNFFKELADIEEVVLVKKYYVTPVGESITYTDSTQRLLLKLIRFVQDGRYVSSSTATAFICMNFRMSSVQLAKAWNLENNAEKSANTFRSQISTLSRKYYKLFGGCVYNAFMNQINEELAVIDMKLSVMCGKDVMFCDIFLSEMEKYCKDYSETVSYDFNIEDCKAELVLMGKLTRNNFETAFGRKDAKKLGYILRVLNTPVINPKTLMVNEEKLNVLKALGVHING